MGWIVFAVGCGKYKESMRGQQRIDEAGGLFQTCLCNDEDKKEIETMT